VGGAWPGWAALSACVGVLVIAGTAHAFPRYDGCSGCHGGFRDAPYISPTGEVWPNSLHEVHRAGSYMSTACGVCHTAGGRANPWIGSSDNDAYGVAAGDGCAGCHGTPDADGRSRGYGLRAHHALAGVTACAGCHMDDPPPPESTLPRNYGGPLTRADDPCNASGLEDWSGNLVGLDNDGDGLYDEADDDCSPGECTTDGECSNGDACDGVEVCNAGACEPGTPLVCDDGNACNGIETCDPATGCVAGTPLDCDDGDPCTTNDCEPTIGCTTIPEPCDAGAGDAGAGDAGAGDAGAGDAGAGDGGMPEDAGTDGAVAPPDAAFGDGSTMAPPIDDAGCGCSIPGHRRTTGAAALLLMALVLRLTRRRADRRGVMRGARPRLDPRQGAHGP
jgi:hypothetical protein